MQTNRPNSLLPSREDLINIVRMTLEEDVGSGDITAALIPAGRAATAKIIGRESGILCGTHYAEEVFSQIGLTPGSVAIDWLVGDGDEVKEGTVIASLSGSARRCRRLRVEFSRAPLLARGGPDMADCGS